LCSKDCHTADAWHPTQNFLKTLYCFRLGRCSSALFRQNTPEVDPSACHCERRERKYFHIISKIKKCQKKKGIMDFRIGAECNWFCKSAGSQLSHYALRISLLEGMAYVLTDYEHCSITTIPGVPEQSM
jgi:hypothetical protein